MLLLRKKGLLLNQLLARCQLCLLRLLRFLERLALSLRHQHLAQLLLLLLEVLLQLFVLSLLVGLWLRRFRSFLRVWLLFAIIVILRAAVSVALVRLRLLDLNGWLTVALGLNI
jgi:hypothetical protein